MHQARKDRLSVSLGRCLELNNDFKPGAWAAFFEQLITLHIRTTSNCIERLGMGFGCEAGVVLCCFSLPITPLYLCTRLIGYI